MYTSFPSYSYFLLIVFSHREREWQLIRRGHYIEFNLVHDRGTKFGLCTPGCRTESVLMTLPTTAQWGYMRDVLPGTREFELLKVLKNPISWVEEDEESSPTMDDGLEHRPQDVLGDQEE